MRQKKCFRDCPSADSIIIDIALHKFLNFSLLLHLLPSSFYKYFYGYYGTLETKLLWYTDVVFEVSSSLSFEEFLRISTFMAYEHIVGKGIYLAKMFKGARIRFEKYG